MRNRAHSTRFDIAPPPRFNGAMHLYLRRVDHPQGRNSHRVILKQDGAETELGSISLTTFTSDTTVWTWAIDTVIPMRELESEGEGRDRADCMKQFKAAWLAFAADPARLTEFLEAKRRAIRHWTKRQT